MGISKRGPPFIRAAEEVCVSAWDEGVCACMYTYEYMRAIILLIVCEGPCFYTVNILCVQVRVLVFVCASCFV